MIRCCKDCQERHIGCHGKCEKYQAENQAHRAEKARLDNIRWERNAANNVLINGAIRQIRRRRN